MVWDPVKSDFAGSETWQKTSIDLFIALSMSLEGPRVKNLWVKFVCPSGVHEVRFVCKLDVSSYGLYSWVRCVCEWGVSMNQVMSCQCAMSWYCLLHSVVFMRSDSLLYPPPCNLIRRVWYLMDRILLDLIPEVCNPTELYSVGCGVWVTFGIRKHGFHSSWKDFQIQVSLHL